ncbi:exocyst complex component 1 [Schistocerca cancellata]|uniref:exocyst complex component 1 n=1 Tax=Schistocerca cancellata TaxID=274614 RepID=UPI002118B0E7|nr:exocyst complex component 1 [Schistocerca cancellata]XP_049783052.1 exocyst complex component 1 [Schistocerca cancellata]
MSSVRRILQRELFQPSDEQLVAVVHVSKPMKKKKIHLLCITVSKEKPFSVAIHQVKKTDKNAYKKKRTWLLTEMKLFDGKNVSVDTHEMDIHFDKVYKWVAVNVQERQEFIMSLYENYTKYFPKQPLPFQNIPRDYSRAQSIQVPSEVIVTSGGYAEPVEAEDYLALTDREETDLEVLISQCQFGISNAEAFTDMLAKDLSVLDGENVHSVLASEKQVEQLMEQIEAAITEAERVEARLNSYDEVLCHIRDTMEKMEEKNLLIEVANRNNRKLLSELEQVITQLDLPHKHQSSLVDADLTSPQGLQNAIAAGKALLAAMNAEIHPALVRLASVQEQRKRFEKWKAKFSQTLSRHFNNLFIHLGNDIGQTLSFHANELLLPKHNSVHRELEVYTELMHWCKAMDRKAYLALSKVYTNSLSKLYERDIKQFFEEAKQQISGMRERKGKGSGSNQDITGKLKQQAQSFGPGKTSAPVGLLGMERDQWCIEIDQAERQRFDEVLEKVLAQLEPVCLEEQNFCVSFFQLDVLSPSTKNTQTTLDGLGLDTKNDMDSSPQVPGALPLKKMEKQINEEVRRMMGDLFNCLEPELMNFISYYEKIDSFYCMYVLVRLSQHVMSAQDTGSFLSMTFASALVQVKRSFDRFMMAQLKSIEEARVNRKSKCGILPYVDNFEEFAQTAETIFKSTDRRNDLDKWYLKIVSAMFEAIPRNAAEHHKTPQEVVKMENFHHLHALLSQLKIAVLDGLRKEAKQKYSEALKAYVTQYFGRPLIKLNLFFDGVQAKVAQGVKESEISYQMAYSKQELRKVIKEYPAREVKRGIDNLYRKVEKHLCEQENLLQVVWRAMQEEFIQQYKYIEELIQRCYPGSMITLDFTIQNILEFFSEIARSH